jgi:hypothetical protein
MARFRITQRPSRVRPGDYVYDIQKRVFFSWLDVSNSWLSFETAEQALKELMNTKPVDWSTKVVKEYD